MSNKRPKTKAEQDAKRKERITSAIGKWEEEREKNGHSVQKPHDSK
jgi:hypothetical protein